MKRIGILGGTFDPPHIGHLLIAEEVRLALSLDKIWFIPAYYPPHKDKAMTEANERIKMLKKAISSNEAFDINTFEVDQLGKSYTINTMQALKNNHPDKEFYFIIGWDMVESLPNWYKIDELLKIVSFVGVIRPGFFRESPYPITTVNIPSIDVSSTMIRERLIRSKSVTYLLPDAVYDYIKERRLYEK